MPPTICTEKASKTTVSCDASDNLHRKSFQNKRFVRGFLQFSQNNASKTTVSCDASDNLHRNSFQNERFVRGFLQFSQNNASKTSVSCNASDNLHRKSFQNERFVRGFLQFSQNNASKTQSLTTPGQCAEQFQELKICISPQFCAIGPPNPTKGFILRNQNVRLATTACHPQFQNVRFATAACTKMYESNARRPRQPAPYKNHHFTTVSTSDRHEMTI